MTSSELQEHCTPDEAAALPQQDVRDEMPPDPAGNERRWGWYEAAFLVVLVAALGLRLFELSGRPMHYDEAIHLHYGWRLANSAGALLGWPWIFGTDYVHSAWMHGPFQIEMAAAIFTIFGDTDFTSRLGYALFGTALVGLPYFLRDHIGHRGALIAAVLLTLSPALLYFSRFGRNDIIMMFWAVSLFILMWRYLHGGRRICLYLSSAILALMFATKETAYLLVAIFGLILFIAVLPELLAWLREKASLKREGTRAALLLLLITLTLPQWSAAIGIFQGVLGLTLANPDPLTGNHVANANGSNGLTGAPAWQGNTLLIPIADLPWMVHAALVVVGLLLLFVLLSRGPLNPQRVAGFVGAPVLAAFATAWILFRPYSGSRRYQRCPRRRRLDHLRGGPGGDGGVPVLERIHRPSRGPGRGGAGVARRLVLSALCPGARRARARGLGPTRQCQHWDCWTGCSRQLRCRLHHAGRNPGNLCGRWGLVAGTRLAYLRRHLLPDLGSPVYHHVH